MLKTIKDRVIELYSVIGISNKTEIAKMIKEEFKLSNDVENLRKSISRALRDFSQYKNSLIETDKQEGEFSWREATDIIQQTQKMYRKASSNQDKASIHIDTDKPICVVVLGDLHMASLGTDYDLLKAVTEELINTPNLYAVLVGDLLQMSIKLRGVLEVTDNALPPKFQMMFLESWLEEVKHKILWSTWDNHSVMREEDASGYSKYAEIFNRHTIFHNHIGHVDLKVGKEVYKIASAHFFAGRSIYNPCHSQLVYMQRYGIDRELCIAGDSHVPGILKYTNGEKTRVAINCGTLQTESGYAKRFYTLTTHPVFPCVVLHPDSHIITPLWSVREWLKMKEI